MRRSERIIQGQPASAAEDCGGAGARMKVREKDRIPLLGTVRQTLTPHQSAAIEARGGKEMYVHSVNSPCTTA